MGAGFHPLQTPGAHCLRRLLEHDRAHRQGHVSTHPRWFACCNDDSVGPHDGLRHRHIRWRLQHGSARPHERGSLTTGSDRVGIFGLRCFRRRQQGVRRHRDRAQESSPPARSLSGLLEIPKRPLVIPRARQNVTLPHLRVHLETK